MNEITLDLKLAKTKIDRNIYGHFAEHLGRCIYEGIWVGEDSPIPNVRGIRNDVVEALRKIKMPVLRWPGGCFADEYHWMDGIGPREQRPTMINTHWGGVVENNHFGTHEFLDLCDQLGCEPYICGNVGSGTVQEMSQWVEYVTFDGKSPMADLRSEERPRGALAAAILGVGNENWGCGGSCTAEYYADLYRRYGPLLPQLRRQPALQDRLRPAQRRLSLDRGPDGARPGCEMSADPSMDGLALHYYTCLQRTPGRLARPAAPPTSTRPSGSEIIAKALLHGRTGPHATPPSWTSTTRRSGSRSIVDEWGTWYAVEPGTHPRFLYQQNTMRDALVAALTLDIFNKHCDRVRMANIAQTINVLQAMILTKSEQMLLTPTYHVFEMYTVHQDAMQSPVGDVKCEEYAHDDYSVPSISASASVDGSDKLHLTVSNSNPNKDLPVRVFVRGLKPSSISGRVLKADKMNAHNTFESPTQSSRRSSTALRSMKRVCL